MVAGSEALIPNSGKLVFQDNIIKFEKVPLVTPNGDILIPELTFEVGFTLSINNIHDSLLIFTPWIYTRHKVSILTL